ncbi:MAG: 50S ribosomal protein L6 [Caldisericia bacterium]|nr:50S ribosomal protein L6 [Caldisericia bacterium]MDD3427489.1 50S ribosomal protein L6 [Caldisericia bacterium]MDD5688757.1 50S ribosomal protein L6 [Caldisericia bacterium]HOJ16105.1 50S ribosomal protein L6 [Caldisericia bacterium]HOW02782.1 50S ribosomal protein L6 [Caldisericia bacterium]
MSKVGKKPIIIPENVTVDIDPTTNKVTIKGTKGVLTKTFDKRISIKVQENTIIVERNSDEKEVKKLHGLVRSLINNMIIGVSQGFVKRLELNGVGYKASINGNKLILNLGFTHPIVFEPLDGIEFNLPAETIIEVRGIDKETVGLMASKIRHARKPDPYKGKGVKYAGEILRKKAGKALGKAGA